jgi:hypothetical protein
VWRLQRTSIVVGALVVQAELHAIELQAILKQIVAVHPSGGGDAANYSALNAVIAELA